MSASSTIDIARVELLLSELRLPGVKLMWAKLAAQSDKEGWPAARFLAALAELEVADRVRRRTERHMAEAKLPPGKTIGAFDFAHVPMVSKAQVMALAAGDAWLEKGANVLLFGLRHAGGVLSARRGGKSHLAAALGSGSWSKTAGACCSHAPPTSCSGCRWHGANWHWRPPSPSSNATIC